VSAPSVLKATAVEGGYGRRRIVRGIDMAVRAGEVVALLGPNGAGKTTLMKLLVGLLSPAAGRVTGPGARGIGWVPQGGATYGRLTVRENLELFSRLLQLEDPRAQARAAAQGASLEDWFEVLASDLSGGLRQRLNVAVGLLGDPSLLVLDEPTTGVDLVHRLAMFDVVRERAAAGCGIVFSTHSLEDAATADRVVVVVEGRVVHDGTLAEVASATGASAGTDGLDPVSAGLLALWGDHA